MARSRQVKKTAPVAKQTSAGKADGGEALTFKDYVFLNAVFSGFCLVQMVLVRLLLRDFSGIYFFFAFLMVSFLIVSLFDYFANKLDMGDQIEGNSVPLNEQV